MISEKTGKELVAMKRIFGFSNILKIFFILCFFLLSSCSSIPKEEAFSIVGEWNQYMLTGEDYIYGGTFEVTLASGMYEMRYSKKRDDRTIETGSYSVEVIESLKLSDVSFRSNTWYFKSDWGNGDIGEFLLTPRTHDIFEGWSYLNGEKKTFNRWEKISGSSSFR
jgi:hypothetical protein